MLGRDLDLDGSGEKGKAGAEDEQLKSSKTNEPRETPWSGKVKWLSAMPVAWFQALAMEMRQMLMSIMAIASEIGINIVPPWLSINTYVVAVPSHVNRAAKGLQRFLTINLDLYLS